MPALINYSGEDEFYPGSSCYSSSPMDLGCLLSVGSNAYPPSKRVRIGNSQFGFGRSTFEQDKKAAVSIDVLPEECLFEIFKRLHGGKERFMCASVSKKWLMLLSSIRTTEHAVTKSDDTEMTAADEGQGEVDGSLKRSLEGKKATDVRLAAIAIGTSGRGELGKLSIRGSNSFRGVTDLGLSAIARGCPSLKVLSLWNVSSIGDEGLVEIAKGCPMLEKLDLCQCPLISSKGLIAIAENCPNLTSLSIESCQRIGNEALQAIGKSCSKLQSVSIRDCVLVGDHGVSSLLSLASSVLTKLKLQALNITDCSLAVIGHYGKAVTSLVLYGLQNVSERGFWMMGNAQSLKRLTSLTITSCQGTTDVSLEAIGKGCTSLKQMCLRKCCFVSDNGLVAFSKEAGSLESLQLEECNRVTQSGIVAALSNCGAKLRSLTLVKCMGIKDTIEEEPMLSSCISLRSLSIRNCPGFGSTSLAAVGKLCPHLVNVDLSGLYAMTDAGILSLLESLEDGLVKLNLSGCVNLTDEVAVTASRLHRETLEVLNLDGCRKITDASLAAVAANCLFLRELDVSKSGITDSGLAVIACAEQVALQVLSISGCSGVSNKSLSSLKRIGRSLLGLNLQQCTAISNRSVELLIECSWRCDILA